MTPTLCGLLVHTIVFMLLVRCFLELKKLNEGLDEDETILDMVEDTDEISEKDKKKEEISKLISNAKNLDSILKNSINKL